MNRSQWSGYSYLTLAMMMVGSTVIASRLIAAGLPPFTATAARFAMALPIFLLLMKLTATPWPRPRRHDVWVLICQAGAGSVAYTVLLISGMAHTSAANAGVISGILPAVTGLVAMVLLREKPGRSTWLAVALSSLGVMLLLVPAQQGSAQAGSLYGDGLILAAMVAEALFILLNQRLQQPIPPLALSTLMSALGLLLTAIPALAERPWTLAPMAQAWWAVLYYAVVPTVMGFCLWYAGSARIRGSAAAPFTAVAPLTTVLLAALWLGEPILLWQWLGMGCVLMAILTGPLLAWYQRSGETVQARYE